jgi:hypothetical protein
VAGLDQQSLGGVEQSAGGCFAAACGGFHRD